MAKEEAVAAPIAPKTKEPALNFAELAKEINNIERAVKVLEDRVYNLREKERINSENMIEANKRIFSDIKLISSELLDVKKEIEDLKTKVRLVISELKLLAKKEDLDQVKKYLELWEPLNFVTRREVEKITDSVVEDKLREKGL